MGDNVEDAASSGSSTTEPRLSAVPTSLPALWREGPLWVLCSIVILLFARTLMLGQTLWLRDLELWAFPQRRRFVELWRDGGFPLRDPFIHGGMPFFANLNDAALYPTAFLSLVFGPTWSTNFEIALHIALCAAGAYALARVLGLSKPAAFLAGAAFAFSGPVLSLGNLFNRLLAMPHLAFSLLFWHLYLRDRRRLWFVLCAICGALMILAGSPETFGFTILLALGWSLFADLPEGTWRVRGRLLAGGALLACMLGLGAVQILPAQRLIARSARQRMTYEETTAWSLDPARFPEIAFAGFLGHPLALSEGDYWGLRIDPVYPYLLSIYLGVPVLLLVVAGVTGSRSLWSARFRWFLAGSALLLFMLALGRHAPFYRVLYDSLPGFRLFRYPIKCLTAASLLVALLAASGVDGLRGAVRVGRRERGRVFFAAEALAMAMAALVLVWPAARASIERSLFHGSLPPEADAALAGVGAYALLVTALTAAAVFLARGRNAFGAWALAMLAAADLLVAGRGLNPVVSRDWLEAPPPFAGVVKPLLADGRFYSSPLPKRFALKAPTNDEFWRASWERAVLGEYSAAAFDIPVVFHGDFDGLAPDRQVVAANVLSSLPWRRRLPLLSAASVRVLSSQEPVDVPGLALIREVPNPSDVRIYAYRNDRAAPREAIVTDWIAVPSATASAAAVTDPAFDPRRTAVLDVRGSVPAPSRCDGATLHTSSREPKRTRVETDSACPALVAFSEPWDEGWQAFVDGRRAPLVVSNLVFSAVPVGAGRHTVEILYRPAAVSRGAAISLVTLAGLGVFLVLGRRRSPSALSGLSPPRPGPA